MSFRCSRRLKIAPGVRLSLSRSGVSTSVGRRGAWLPVGPKGTRSMVGLPGSGLSYTETRCSGGGALAIIIILFVFAAFVLF